jgi:hypothetical protein
MQEVSGRQVYHLVQALKDLVRQKHLAHAWVVPSSFYQIQAQWLKVSGEQYHYPSEELKLKEPNEIEGLQGPNEL